MKLAQSEEFLQVDEVDVEKVSGLWIGPQFVFHVRLLFPSCSGQANPSSLDHVEDIIDLIHLNESSVIHVLRQRYASSLIHTFSGRHMIIINPLRHLSLYSDRVGMHVHLPPTVKPVLDQIDAPHLSLSLSFLAVSFLRW